MHYKVLISHKAGVNMSLVHYMTGSVFLNQNQPFFQGSARLRELTPPALA